MTTPEHTLVGLHAAFLCGVQSRMGWVAIVLAAIASNVPDLDGLTILGGIQMYDAGHRLWGHNFLVIGVTSLCLAWTQYRYRWIDRIANRSARFLPTEARSTISQPVRETSFAALFLVLFFCQTVHLPCDMVVSGGADLSDWPVVPFWPFATISFVCPLIPWGDPGPTIILMLGAIGLAKLPGKTRLVAGVTLLVLVLYLVGRGMMRGTIGG